MAETTVAPTNKAVAFRGKPSVEPTKYPNKVRGLTDEEVEANEARRPPARPQISGTAKSAIKSALSRGMVSEAAVKKHLGEV